MQHKIAEAIVNTFFQDIEVTLLDFSVQTPDEFHVVYPSESRRAPDPALPGVRSRFTTASPLVPWLWSPPAFATIGYIVKTQLNALQKGGER